MREPPDVPRHRRRAQRGFAVSLELLLIALLLTAGLVTGWAKLRDSSLAEVKDTINAIDAYVLASTPLWETGATRWIIPCENDANNGCIQDPALSIVTEGWGENADPWVTVAGTNNAGNTTYESLDDVLLYMAGGAE
jgi:Tfp pilus assembly protein PilV